MLPDKTVTLVINSACEVVTRRENGRPSYITPQQPSPITLASPLPSDPSPPKSHPQKS